MHVLMLGDINGGEIKFQQFFPTTTIIQPNPILQSMTQLTATVLALQTASQLTQQMEYSLFLTPQRLAMKRHYEEPLLISQLEFDPNGITITGPENTTNTITHEQQTLTKTHRETSTQTITDEQLEVSTDITVPQTSISKTTTETTQLTNTVLVPLSAQLFCA